MGLASSQEPTRRAGVKRRSGPGSMSLVEPVSHVATVRLEQRCIHDGSPVPAPPHEPRHELHRDRPGFEAELFAEPGSRRAVHCSGSGIAPKA